MHFKSISFRSNAAFLFGAVILVFVLFAPLAYVRAAELTPEEQTQVAALFTKLGSLRKILEALKESLRIPSALAAAPVIQSDVRAENIIGSGAQVKWSTDLPSDSQVYYGTNSSPTMLFDYSSNRCDAGGFVTSHCVSLTSLAASTLYYYKVKSCSSDGTCTEGSGYSFTSAGGSGVSTVPAMPTGFLATLASNNTDVNLSWVDAAGETEYKISRRLSGGSWVEIATVGANIVSYTNLAVPAGTYDYHINACNSSGCSADSSMANVTVSAADTTAPSAPTGLTASVISSSQIDLSWGSSTDNVAVASYKIFRDAIFITSTAALSYSDSALSAGTTYSYYVKAADAAGNESLSSATVSATTRSVGTTATTTPDTTPPSSPTGLGASAVSSSQIDLSWLAATDNVGVTGYKIFKDNAYFVTTTSLSYSDINLSAVTTYSYYVKAMDAVGNESTPSATISATTLSTTATTTTTTPPPSPPPATGADTTPPIFSNVRVENIIGTGAQIKWNTDDLSDSRVLYGTAAGFYPNFSEFRCDAGGNVADHCGNLSGLAFSTRYYYKAVSRNSSGYEGSSAEFNFLSAASSTLGTTTAYTIPAPPTGFTAVSTQSSVSLSWLDVVGEDRYDVYRRLAGGTTGWEYRGKTGPDTHGFSESGLVPGTYEYQIFACNFYGCSGGSNIAVIGVAGAATATTTVAADTVPPYVSQFGQLTELDGRLRAGALFSESIDQATLNDLNVYIIVASDGSRVPGVVNRYPSGVDYFTSSPVNSALEYQLVVKGEVKDLSGNRLAQDYISERIRPGVQITPIAPPPLVSQPFAVDTFGTFPRNTEVGVSHFTRIHVKLTKEVDLASTIAQFFILSPLASPDRVINGTFQFFGDSFEFVPSVLLEQNTTYIYKVLTTLKDKSGAGLSSPYSATFTTRADITAVGATIEGAIKDAQGGAVASASVFIYREDFGIKFAVMSGRDGLFRISVPAGTYFIEVYPPFDRRDLVRPLPVKVSVSVGEKRTLSLQFVGLTKLVTGAVKFSDGTAVTDAEVGAYSHETHQWTGTAVESGGFYTLRLGGGKWTIGIRPKDPLTAKWSYSGPFREITFSKDSTNETQIIDFTVPILDAVIRVTVVDDEDRTLAGVGVVLDTTKAGTPLLEGGVIAPPQFRLNDSSGIAKFNVSSGRYYVRAYFPPARGYINPPEQEATVGPGRTVEVKVVFRRLVAASTILLKGTVKLEDGTPTDAFVWAWSEKGGYISTFSSAAGLFEHKVTPFDRWHIGAGKEINGIPHKSSDIIVDIGETSASVELVLVKLSRRELPSPVVVRETATQQIVAQVEDGARAIIPPQAAASSGTVSVEMKATVEAPSQAAAQVVSTVYDVSIRDAAGKSVTSLKEEVEITIPYDEAELLKEGVNEDAVVPSFFDDKTGTWVRVENFTIDKDKNVVVLRVKHLTRFALVAAADITPPSPPIDVSISALGQGRVKITWSNPARDFDHAKVYRSEKKGELGKLVGVEVKANIFTDEEGIDGTTYYYTVRAVDPAGNETNNTNQVSVKVVGTAAKMQKKAVAEAKPAAPPGAMVKLEILRNLSAGSSGEDVKVLQELLLKEGVYPQGLITGFFGELTRQAVVRFQEKYASEILTPSGLSQGNGFVGPATRNKLTKLLGAPPAAKPALAPGQAIKLEILRNLTVGTSGDDVKALQELLLKEGVYPQGLITGFFGELTRSAVIRFQEKYAQDILVPADLTQGNGFVGPATRKKLNGLLSR